MKKYLYNFISNYTEMDYKIFTYSYNLLIIYIFVFIILSIISLILDITIELFTFLIIFIPLKKYMGGIHFSSKVICIITSILFATLISYTGKMSEFPIFIRLIVFAFTLLTTIYFKTINHPNKKLSDKEIRIYTKNSIIIELIYGLILMIPFNQISFIINIITSTLLFFSINNALANLLNAEL